MLENMIQLNCALVLVPLNSIIRHVTWINVKTDLLICGTSTLLTVPRIARYHWFSQVLTHI